MLGQIVKWLNSQFVKKCKYIETMERQDFENPEFSFFAGTLSVFLCIIFGSNAVAIKLAFAGVGVFTSAAIRFSIAALAIFLWTRVTGQTIGLKKGQLHQVLILAALFAIQLSMFYFGLSKSNASRGTLIVNLLPFWVLFLAHFFIPGDRITKRKFLGILLGFGGVAFMFAEKTGVTAGFRVGDLIILTATTIWACSVIYLKRIIGSFNPFQVTFYSMVFSVPIFFIEALLWDRPMIFKLNLQIMGSDYAEDSDCLGVNCGGYSGCAFETPQRRARLSDSERDLGVHLGVRCQKTEDRWQKAGNRGQNLIIRNTFRLVLLTPET
jgi:drug/metabolite transporter (DMT)-like permease